MSSIGGIGGIGTVNLTGVKDLGTAMMMVQTNRANALEGELKGQLERLEGQNRKIAQLNDCIGKLNQVLAGGGNRAELEKEINALLKQVDVKPFPGGGGLTSGSTGPEIEAAVGQLRGAIETQNASQQMDMVKLQGLTNKRNEAFDLMTNFIKKMHENGSSILGNMR